MAEAPSQSDASRMFREVVEVEIFAMVAPDADVHEQPPADSAAIVRDAVQANDDSPPGVWLICGEIAVSGWRELT